jgi:hypothetical protein
MFLEHHVPTHDQPRCVLLSIFMVAVTLRKFILCANELPFIHKGRTHANAESSALKFQLFSPGDSSFYYICFYCYGMEYDPALD